MNAEAPVDQISQNKNNNGPEPEIQRFRASLEKPSPTVYRVPVAGHDIVHRIDLKQPADILKASDIKHDRHGPGTELLADPNDLGHIPEENHYSACRIDQPEKKYKHREIIIDDLDQIDIRIIAVNRRNYQCYQDEEQM